ncbi:SDR family oxidoreductase [Nocardiopsis rhodophaea]|uniref:SDR family oxidoreductase n=1 Tax=Nocardiopsis rhodophaea TaxID=280238 RepID=A0ABN2S5H6_9ACTN
MAHSTPRRPRPEPIAVVTGASSGIGRAAALALATPGYRLGLAYRSDEAGAEATARAVRAAGAEALPFQLDLAHAADSAARLEKAVDELGGIGVLVNNAGVNRRSPLIEERLDDWHRVVETDLTGPFACMQVAARRMIAAGRGGRILNITSVHEHIPIRDGAAYCAAKGGLGMLTQVAALELAEHDITVNALAPGETATPMNGVPEGVDAADISRPGIPVGRPGRPEEVAALVAALVGPAGDYTTGASITVDGGLTLMAAISNQADAGRL